MTRYGFLGPEGTFCEMALRQWAASHEGDHHPFGSVGAALRALREGRIDVAVPVRGNVDAPEFSYGQVVLKALGKLLGDLVTAPFRALGAMFGGGGENPDTLHFQPGQAALAPPEEQLLGNIAQALASRPQLGLEIRTGFDPQLDGAAINDEIVRRAIELRIETRAYLQAKLRP